MGFDDICNTRLSLGPGCLVKQENSSQSDHHRRKKTKKKKILWSSDDRYVPSLTLGPSDDADRKARGNEPIELHRRASSVTVSLFSNSSVKKLERDFGDEDDEGSPRKKLRLSKQQSTVLEDIFKEHTNLNPKLKQALADQLNLTPRQVEVWFQNRRARTKLKQTEVDCELMKKCCDTLTEQNKMLHKELEELKSWKLTASYSMQLPATTLTLCPSCEKIAKGEAHPSTTSIPFTIGQKSHFFNPLSHHPSAACN